MLGEAPLSSESAHYLGRAPSAREASGRRRTTASHKKANALETAVKLKPDLSEAYYHLSRVYRKLGRPDGAARALEKFRKSRAREDTEREHLLRMVREQQEAQ